MFLVSLTQPKRTEERSLSEGLGRSGQPMGVAKGGFSALLNGGEKIYPLWVALFSGQGVLDCLKPAEH